MFGTNDASIAALHRAEAAYCVGTAEHSTRVSRICGLLAATLDLPAPDVETVRWTGLLHDIGKIAVPLEVLVKPGPLTAEEWQEVKRHPVVGAEMVLGISACLVSVAEGVRAHHERWDGSGYPDGRDGSDIPMSGRIVAVADVYDALSNHREYRPGLASHSEARAFVVNRAGRDFDPAVVRAFADLDKRG